MVDKSEDKSGTVAAKLPPVFDLTIGASSMDSSIRVNGQDISRYVSGVTIDLNGGELTKLTLTVHGRVRAKVDAAIEDVHVVEIKDER